MYSLLISIFLLSTQPDIYGYSFVTISGDTVHLSDYRGKMILLVNTASSSIQTPQYARLEQLYEQYKDSLVVIAFPSNAFGHETGDNNTISRFLSTSYTIQFPVASKSVVSGDGQTDLYQWLTSGQLNGAMVSTINDDFQKYLIDKNGHLVGFFAGAVDPFYPGLISIIQGN